jgi:hypothetical protein
MFYKNTTQIMKRFSIAAIFAATFLLSSCQRTEEANIEPDDFAQFQTLIQQNTRIQSAIQALIQMTNDIMDKSKANGRVSAEMGELPTCANIDPDLKNKIIIVDFSNGCGSPYGTIKGSITVNYTGAFGQSGASINIRMNNFAVGGMALNGTVGINDFKKTGINLLEYKVKLTDLTTAYEGSSLRTTMEMGQSWKNFQTTNSNDDEVITSLKGSYFVNDLSYDVETTTNLLMKGACSTNVAVSGIMKIALKDMSGVLDYGTGSCDMVGTLTVGGQSKPVELR